MVLLKREIEDQQSSFQVFRADTEKLSDEPAEILQEVFDASFMEKYTRYNSIGGLINDSPANLYDDKSFQTAEFDRFISKQTVFDDWDEMKKKASEDWVVSEMNF